MNDTPRHDGRGWTADHKRRVAVLYVGEDAIFDVAVAILTDAKPPKHRMRLVADDLPRDCSVVSVCHDWQRRAFGFLLFHESFEPVPDGCPAPQLNADTRWEFVLPEPDPDPIPLVFEPSRSE